MSWHTSKVWRYMGGGGCGEYKEVHERRVMVCMGYLVPNDVVWMVLGEGLISVM